MYVDTYAVDIRDGRIQSRWIRLQHKHLRYIAFPEEESGIGCLNLRACGVQRHLFLLGR